MSTRENPYSRLSDDELIDQLDTMRKAKHELLNKRNKKAKQHFKAGLYWTHMYEMEKQIMCLRDDIIEAQAEADRRRGIMTWEHWVKWKKNNK